MQPSDLEGQNRTEQPDLPLHAAPSSTGYVPAGSAELQPVPLATSYNDAVVAAVSRPRLLPIIARLGLGILALLLVVGVVAIALHKNQPTELKAGSFNTQQLALQAFESGPAATAAAQTLTVNGQLRANNSLVLTPSIQPANGVAGQLYYDQISNQLAYYNGTGFVTLSSGTTIQSNNTVINNSTTTVNGTANATTSVGGRLNTVAKFTGNGTIGNSIIVDDGSNVTIAGNLNLVNTSPTSQMTIWPADAIPGVPDYMPDNQAVEVGIKFQSDVNGIVQGMRFYKGTQNTGTHIGNLWSSAGTLLASVTFTNETTTGWQTALFSHPVAISAATTYIISYHTNVGNYASDVHYFAFNGFDNPPLHALQDGTDGSNGVFKYSATSVFPNTSSINASNYWVDVLFTPGSNPFFFEINGAQLSSTSLSNNYDLAKRSSGQVFTGINTFRNAIDSSAAFVIQDAESDSLLVANTAAQEVDVTKLDVTGNLFVGTHVVTQGSAPTILPGPAACTTPTADIFGNDTAGLINITTGTGCTGPGKFTSITFHTPFTTGPRVILTPANAAAAEVAAYIDNSTITGTSFDLQIASGTITASTSYLWYYHILQ